MYRIYHIPFINVNTTHEKFGMKKGAFLFIQIFIFIILFFLGCTTGERASGKWDGHPGMNFVVQIEEGVSFIVRSYDIIVDSYYPRALPGKMLAGAIKGIREDYKTSFFNFTYLLAQHARVPKETTSSDTYLNEEDDSHATWFTAEDRIPEKAIADARETLREMYLFITSNQPQYSPMAIACSMVDGMLHGLDSYSTLLTPEAYNKLKDSITSSSSIQYTALSPGYGYIRIIDFNENTTRDMIEAINSLQSTGPYFKGLILDLRDNHGGLFDQAITVSDLFLKHGTILHIRGRNEGDTKTVRAHPDTYQGDYPIVALMNSASASGSEIVAAALQDNRRALLIGERSHGKGLAQTVVPLYNNYALKFTSIGYFRPNGAGIQGQGIEPDIVFEYENKPFSLSHITNDHHVQHAFEMLKNIGGDQND